MKDLQNKNEKGISDYEQYESNPFLPNLLIPRKNTNVTIANSDHAIFNKETGEIKDDTLFIGVKKTVDKEEFVKIFHAHLSAIFDLSKGALKVFSYIASCTDFGDRVIFQLTKCVAYTGYTGKATIYKSLAELCKAEIIARTIDSNIYFINPQIFYKGDRMVLMTEYRKKKTGTIENKNQLDLFKN